MGQSERNDIELVAKAREGAGSGMDLLIDAGLSWDGRTAIRRAKAFADYDIFWLEEPLRPDDYTGYRKLSEATDIHIAAGEHESHRLSFLELMDRGRIDVVQVDLARCGITEAMKIASLAHDRGLKVANHGFSTYINVAAALHWLNSVPNALIAEFVVQEATDLRERITREKTRARDGFLSIPQEPGLGIELDEEEIAQLRIC
jgi:L-alanine-DL-glutamate epimerase-like enolase superfamily enzyme